MFDATPFLRLYSGYRSRHLSSQDPAHAQTTQLLSLVRRASQTVFGRDHDFASIRTVEDFQKRVPLRTYEAFWSAYLSKHFPRLENVSWPGVIPYFAVSSGTTSGTTKWIPVSREMINSNKKAGLDLLVYHLLNRPQSRVFSGKSFILGGSTDFVQQAPGIYSGDLSGIAAKTLPWWAAPRYFPPAELALLKNWEEKIERMARSSLHVRISSLSGVPSWLLILIGKLHALCPEAEGDLAKIYPHLDLLIHGGVNFAPYLHQFREILAHTSAELREVYPASEGFIATADRGSGDGLRLNCDHDLFFEFVPLEELKSANPTRHWVATLEKDVNYAVVMSTCSGLWGYVIGDTVRFTDLTPPRLFVTGRTSYYLSAFGEHVIAEELELAVSTAAEAIGATVSDYSVGPIYPQAAGELGGHLYLVEFTGALPPADVVARFGSAVDSKLCALNEDYDAHRAKGFGLRLPEVRAVPQGTFAAWMKSRGKLGGQHKVPRIITDRDLFQGLQDFCRNNAP